MTPGSSIIVMVQFSDADIGLRRDLSGSALPKFPQSASRGTRISGLPGLLTLRPVRLLAPYDGSDQVSPAPGGFYFQASGSSVTLAAAGYDYNMDWTPYVGGIFARWNGS